MYSVGPLQPLHKCLVTDSFGGTAHYSPVMMQEGTLQMSTAQRDDSVRHSELISWKRPRSRSKNSPDEGTIQLWGPADWPWLICAESVSSRRVTIITIMSIICSVYSFTFVSFSLKITTELLIRCKRELLRHTGSILLPNEGSLMA